MSIGIGAAVTAVHRFSAMQRRLRDDWFARVETHDRWIDEGPVGEGESQSIRVRNSIDGMLGIAKPGPALAAQVDHCRAAHERLAFSLGYLAALPVSAVLLWSEDLAKYQRGRSISSWAFPQAMKWAEADRAKLISPASKSAAGPLYSMMRVFHTWIGDSDRKGDHIIVDLESPDGDLCMAFIDHGHSLSHAWKADSAAAVPCPAYLAGVPVVAEAMIEAAEHIAAIPGEEIAKLVTDIPAAYLPDPYRGNILQNLLARKGTLRATMGV